MMNINRRFIAVALGWLVAMSSSIASPIVSIGPPVTSISAGSSIDVTVDISGVADLYAFQFNLSFDPAVISAIGVDEGLFLQGGGSTFFILGAIDNSLGTVSFTANSLIGAVSGVSGDGTLAMIHLLAAGAGTSSLSLSGVSLLDSSLSDITFTTASGLVEVTGAVPEPASIVLVVVGTVALASMQGAVRRRRRAR